ncbi:hypothetical protein [Mycobacterium sp. ACS4331]|uniref:hypothetical protein n=1 Tax=Mycobacterium sp. ACS4331 TaxID=1834121 RepID=UPI0007FE6AE6|nr:hypothetical protein [Mycobacterium sp. ACS4331]OBF29764.1 hypothetical protein A5727_23125 [Mycobacterium sp. ACS4331]
MVLPLIPVALIAIGAVTGGSGLALGGKAALDFKKAQSQLKDAGKRYEDCRAKSEARVAETNESLADLGQEQQQALTDVVVRMAEFLRRHQKQVRENERLLVEGLDATMNQIPGLAGLDVNAASWIAGAVGSAATAVGAGSGVTAAAGMLGVASTGTAISGLSGVAAQNATMAFLGGGSLASGGGGMALGATALNFVTLGPALLVGGFVAHTQGDRALTKAREECARIAVAIAELDELDAKLSAIDSRTEELRDVLTALRERAVAALDLLESEPFEPAEHASRFQHAMTLAVAVRDVAAAPIVDETGDLTASSEEVTVKYRPMVEEGDDV